MAPRIRNGIMRIEERAKGRLDRCIKNDQGISSGQGTEEIHRDVVRNETVLL